MEDVTDPAFRLMCKKFGADMVYTEFVSADALIRSVGKTMQKLNINDEERPVAMSRPPSIAADIPLRQKESRCFPRAGGPSRRCSVLP